MLNTSLVSPLLFFTEIAGVPYIDFDSFVACLSNPEPNQDIA